MIVCQLDNQGYFIGITTADESPLEPGVYLLPSGCIQTNIPNVPDGKLAKWNNGWVFEDIPQPEPEPAPPTPEELQAEWLKNASVSMRQARLALLQLNLLDQVDAAITDRASKIEWEYATSVERNSPLVQNLSSGLGLSQAQLDDLFILAASL